MAHVKSWLTKPWVVMPLVAVVVLGGWAMFFRSSASGSGTVQTTDQVVAATSGSIAETVSAQGTVAATQTDNLNFASSGTVTAVNVKAGQQVSTGDVLAQIDSSALQASLSQAQASAAQAAAKLSDDEAAGASSAQIAADETSVATANDKVTTAQTALDGAQLVATFDGTVSQVNLTVGEQLGNSGASGTTTTGTQSPSGGSTSNLGSGSGGSNATQNASANGTSSNSGSSSTPQVQVITASSFTVDLGFDSTDIAKIANGQSATISLSTSTSNTFGGFGGGGFPGGGRFTGGGFTGGNGTGGGAGSGNGSTSSGNTTAVAGTSSATGSVTDVGTVAQVTSGVAKFPVTVSFTDQSGTFNPDATVDVSITYAEKQNAVQVPTAAITTNNGASTVNVSKNGSTESRTVTTGLTSGIMTEITSGLQAGEQVVISFPTFGGGGNRTGNGEFPTGGFGGRTRTGGGGGAGGGGGN